MSKSKSHKENSERMIVTSNKTIRRSKDNSIVGEATLSFNGRLLGTMTNEEATAVKHTPNIGKKIFTQATFPLSDFFMNISGLRVVIADTDKRKVIITPVVNRVSHRWLCKQVSVSLFCKGDASYELIWQVS